MEKMAAWGELGSFIRFQKLKMLLEIFKQKLEITRKLWYNVIKEKGENRVKWNLLRNRSKA